MTSLPDPSATATEPGGEPRVVAALHDAVANGGGRITFARFMEIALYHPEGGYYLARAPRAAREGDFITAPELHPLFGITLARQIAECRERLGSPRPFTIREYGAGSGVLAYDILAGLADLDPDALNDLRYELVEPNPHRRREALAAMQQAGLGEIVSVAAPDDPLTQIIGVAIANEVADALPVHRLVWRDDGFREGYVTTSGDSDGFAEAEGPLSPEMVAFDPAAYLARHGITLSAGDRIECSPAAAAWMSGVARGIARGYAIVIDYGYPANRLYRDHRLGGLVRAYRGHTVTDDPFAAPGLSDLTAHVDFTLLQDAGEAEGLVTAGFTSQGALLVSLGLGDHLVRLGQDPETTAEEYYATQAAILHLIDPGGLGRFGVLIMARDAPVEPPLLGFGVRL